VPLRARTPRRYPLAMVAMLRLGTVPYLNSRPLVAGLAAGPGITLEEAVPSELARRLRAGALDAALVSAVELFRAPPLSFVAGPAITSEGPVRSILLFLRCAPERVRSVGLDTSSRSAAALTRICLEEFLGARPRHYADVPPDAPLDALETDAVLRIGDPALAAPRDGHRYREALDLGEVWTAHTALPFVYALWLVRPGVPAEPLRARLLAARAAGLPQRDALADAFAARAGLPAAACRDYLQHAIGYDLGPAERAGLEAFGFLAHRCGLVDSPVVPEALGG
jgi:chorismate dehydratase